MLAAASRSGFSRDSVLEKNEWYIGLGSGSGEGRWEAELQAGCRGLGDRAVVP